MQIKEVFISIRRMFILYFHMQHNVFKCLFYFCHLADVLVQRDNSRICQQQLAKCASFLKLSKLSRVF